MEEGHESGDAGEVAAGAEIEDSRQINQVAKPDSPPDGERSPEPKPGKWFFKTVETKRREAGTSSWGSANAHRIAPVDDLGVAQLPRLDGEPDPLAHPL